MTYTIGFDLGGTKMLCAVFNGEFKIVGTSRKKTKGNEGSSAGMDRIMGCVQEALAEAKVAAKDVGALGIAIPGLLDLDKGVLLDAPNLGWKNVAVADQLGKAYKCPVTISNDVDAGVYGEYRYGAARGARSVLGVFPGTGIGGGFVYEGKILTGKSKSCMEIGHIQLMPKGPLCGCGQKGCLEALASRLAISSAAAMAAFRGEAPALLRLAGTDIANIRSGVLAQAISEGDKTIELIVRRAAKWLGVGISIAVNLLDPDIVVIGGGLVEAMPLLWKEEVERVSRGRVMSFLKDDFRIVVAKLGDQATVTGAAAWAIEQATAKKNGK